VILDKGPGALKSQPLDQAKRSAVKVFARIAAAVSSLMTVQLGFLEPLEWDEETQKDFSISRLGGLPVFSYAVLQLTAL
jgi:hypothetical protein